VSETRYPNESVEYRRARDELLEEERKLVEHTKAVAALRRRLPPGGELTEDYTFTWASEDKLGQPVKLSELFGDQKTLLLYNFMFGPGWDNPCPSCTSLMDGFDRTAYQVTRHAAFAGIAKATHQMIHDWARQRGWTQIPLVSGYGTTYQADYRCQGESDDMQRPVMHVFRKHGSKIRHFWGTELQGNHVDTVWPYWNLMDFTPEGRPDVPVPPQRFRSKLLEENYLNRGSK